MAFINWKPEYSVGNATIDAQHQKLVAMIADLHEAMKSGKGVSEAKKIVNEMVDYAALHFKTEEEMMAKYGYKGLAEHVKEHQAFVVKVSDFQKQVNLGTLSISLDLANFLREWLTNHILVNDKAYSGMFK